MAGKGVRFFFGTDTGPLEVQHGHWKYTIPKGKARLPTIISQGRAVKLREGNHKVIFSHPMDHPIIDQQTLIHPSTALQHTYLKESAGLNKNFTQKPYHGTNGMFTYVHHEKSTLNVDKHTTYTYGMGHDPNIFYRCLDGQRCITSLSFFDQILRLRLRFQHFGNSTTNSLENQLLS